LDEALVCGVVVFGAELVGGTLVVPAALLAGVDEESDDEDADDDEELVQAASRPSARPRPVSPSRARRLRCGTGMKRYLRAATTMTRELEISTDGMSRS
jgi:hypothetical protein